MANRKKKFNSLDDIDRKFLDQPGVGGRVRLSAEKMTASAGGRDPRQLLLAAAVLLLLILSVVLIMVSCSRKSKEKAAEQARQESAAAAEAEKASLEAESRAAAEEAAKRKQGLKRCEIPELRQLVKRYFDARLHADTAALKEIFGRSDTSPDPEYEAVLTAQARHIQTFDNIEVYAYPGLEKDARVLIITYEVNFRRTDTPAPGIMYAYAVHNADGSYILAETLSKERQELIGKITEDPDIRAMIDGRNERLRANLEKDSTLALIYVSFLNGAVYKESNLETDKEQQIDIYGDPQDSILIDQNTAPQASAAGVSDGGNEGASAGGSPAAPEG